MEAKFRSSGWLSVGITDDEYERLTAPFDSEMGEVQIVSEIVDGSGENVFGEGAMATVRMRQDPYKNSNSFAKIEGLNVDITLRDSRLHRTHMRVDAHQISGHNFQFGFSGGIEVYRISE